MPLPANPFYASAAQRVALARRQFFEDGVRPSGVVSDAVIQSWTRCLQSHLDPVRPAVFEPVTASRVHALLGTHRELLQIARTELDRMRDTLRDTGGTAILTDAQGITIATTYTGAVGGERVMPVSARVGVNLSEAAVGTTAPGITARSGRPSVVLGCEHFFANVHEMHCAAAPIRDRRGQVAAVLDLSREGRPFGFDAAAVVAHFAAEIENRLLCAQSNDHLVVRLHLSQHQLASPEAGLIGITGDGRIDWANAAAARWLGLTSPLFHGNGVPVDDVLGTTLAVLTRTEDHAEPQPLHLPNGLRVWWQGEWHSRGAGRQVQSAAGTAPTPRPAAAEHAAPPPAAAMAEMPAAPATLRETSHQLTTRLLTEHGGNVSKVARLLGVSRGRVYRLMRGPAG